MKAISLFISLIIALGAMAQTPITVTLPEGVDSVTTTTTITTVTRTYRSSNSRPAAPATVAPPRQPSIPEPHVISPVQSAPAQVWDPDIIETDGLLDSEPEEAVVTITEPLYTDSLHGYPLNEQGKMVLATIDPELLSRTVIVGNDTVPFILPQRNYGRYDRGLYNFLFIPKGQWMFGLTASYGEFSSEDIEILSLLKDLSFKGKIYSLQPTLSYFIRNNQSMGLKFNYTRAIADLGGLSVDFDDDLNFTLSNVSYYSQNFSASIFYRNYVGLGAEKRFAIFNEVDLAFGSGSSRFLRSYDGEPKDTKTLTTKVGLNFSPGLTVFIMDQVCFNVSFGVFGLHVTHDKQYTNGADEGSRTSSGANFRFNLFNINFGIGVTI